MRPVQSLHHVGIAVRSIEAQRGYYEQVLGANFEGIEEIPDYKIRVAFFRVGDVLLELLEPIDASSTIQKFLDNRGEGLHHVAFGVVDLPARIAELKEAGIRMIDDTPRRGAHQLQIAFLHPRSTSGVLTELVEPA